MKLYIFYIYSLCNFTGIVNKKSPVLKILSQMHKVTVFDLCDTYKFFFGNRSFSPV